MNLHEMISRSDDDLVTPRADAGLPAVAVSVPVVNEATGLFQVAVVEDELGAVTFHVGERDRPRVDRGVPTTTFTFPSTRQPTPRRQSCTGANKR